MSKFLNAILTSNVRRLSSPLKLSYAVTYRCNLKCAMCRIWDKTDHSNELKVTDIEKLFVRPHDICWVGITGGEPFLREDLIDIVDAILRSPYGISAIHFATNGTLTSRIERMVRDTNSKYKKIKILFTISIDGPPDLHNKIRGKENVWQDALTSFKLLKTYRNVKPQFGFTLSHSNIGRFDETFRALQEAYPRLRYDDMTVNIFQKSSFYYDNQAMPTLPAEKLNTEINNILKQDHDTFSINNFLRRVYLKLYLEYLQTKKSPVKCQSFASTCFLDPYGNLFPCAVYNRRLLNIRNSDLSIKDIWKLPETLAIHHECAVNRCPSCWSPCDAYSAIGGSLIQSVMKS